MKVNTSCLQLRQTGLVLRATDRGGVTEMDFNTFGTCEQYKKKKIEPNQPFAGKV